MWTFRCEEKKKLTCKHSFWAEENSIQKWENSLSLSLSRSRAETEQPFWKSKFINKSEKNDIECGGPSLRPNN